MILRIGLILAILAALGGIYWAGHHAGAESVQVKWEADKLERANKLIATVAKYRKQEREWSNDVQDAEDRLAESREETRQALDAALVGIDTGRLRLRTRDDLPRDAQTTCRDDAAGGAYVSSERARNALRRAAEADDIVGRLTMCQDYARACEALR